MRRYIVALCLVCCLLARTKFNNPAFREFQNARHDTNNIQMVISNYGTFGQSESGYSGGCWWAPSGWDYFNFYIYGAGIWFGAISSLTYDTLVTVGYEPLGGQHEFAPGLSGWSASHPAAIIYMYPANWPPLSDTFPMAPQVTLSSQDSWCCYNDSGIQYHMPGDTRPIGLEVYQTVYAWNSSTTADIIFLKFDCKNVSGEVLNDCYFGVMADCDIGDEVGAAANDRCSGIIERWYVYPNGDSIHVDDLGYQWQEEPEGTWPIFPGTIGIDYLQSPYDLEEGADKDGDTIPDQFERDSVYYVSFWPPYKWDVDFDGIPDWRDPSQIPQLGLTSFKRFTLALEPAQDNQRYMTMAGYNFVTGQYDPYDTIAPDPADQRFGQCSGPFELLPDSIVTVLVGVMVTAWSDEAPGAPPGYYTFDTPDSALALVDQTAQFIFDQNWLLPGPPPPPTVTLIPGDAQITLLWDTSAETYPDPYYDVVGDPASALYDSFYLQYDFQGYGVWKSTDGQDYELLARVDIADDIAFEDEVTGIYARNTGLVHSWIDDEVRNGFTYYYAVTAFDYNYVAAETSGVEYGQPVWFESGRVGVTAMARRDPANLVPGDYDVSAVYGNPMLVDNNIEVSITYPLEMTADPMYLDFGPIVYDGGDPRYSATLLDLGYNVLDGFAVTLAVDQSVMNEFMVQQGLSIAPVMVREDIPTSVSIFDAVVVESGTYPETLLAPVAMPTNWAYRGNDFRVYWRALTAGSPVNTVTVVDVYSGDTIPFKSGTTDTLADGWCFQSLSQRTDTLVYSTSVPLATRTLYICGGEFRFKPAGGLVPGDPVPSASDVWLVQARTDYLPAPANARLAILSTPAFVDTDTDITLNVKVVPNPYIITNEWQLNLRNRQLKFINLPDDCTIRIFNLNGELVRMIDHQSTSEDSDVLGDLGGDEWWNLLSDNSQLVASGVYIFHIQSDVGEQVGKFVVIR